MSNKRIVFALVALFIITIYLLEAMKPRIIHGEIIALVFDQKLLEFLREHGVKAYMLNSDILNTMYYANKMIIITHAARYGDKLLIALNDEPDPFTIYAIEINGSIYKAITLKDLAEHVYANKLFIASCFLNEKDLIEAFKGHVNTLYYYSENATPEYVYNDVLVFINNDQLLRDNDLISIIKPSSSW